MGRFVVAGTTVELTAPGVAAALRGVAPEPVVKHAVDVGGQLFPVVQALEAASGVPRASTRSARARAVLTALGMWLVELDSTTAPSPRQPSAPHGAPVVNVAAPIGGAWKLMASQPAHLVADLDVSLLPSAPGVYAFYRDGKPMYVGRAIAAGGLRRRLSTQHLRTGNDLSWSAFRRNVAAHLGVAPTAVTKKRPPQLTDAQVAPVVSWVQECELRWIACTTREQASTLEEQLKAERKPPFTKR